MSDCEICRAMPGSHSFMRLAEGVGGEVYYYTCPGAAIKYNDLDGIIKHYTLELDKLGGKDWVWILDGTGFSMKHALELQLAIELSGLVEKYKVSKICVINPNIYVKIIKSGIWLFLSSSMRDRIVFDERGEYVLC
jgi:hypothetical protein